MLQVRLKIGSEGPTYDPYGYEQWEIRRDNQIIQGHFGLVEWVKVGPSKKELQTIAVSDNALGKFEELVGLSMRRLRQAYERIHHTCKKCGCRHTINVDGYPGEYLNVCVKCDEVVSADFNESEII